MNRKGVVIWLSFVLVFSFIVITVEIAPVVEAPTTWYVDDIPGSGPGNPPEDFTSIQDAINASIDGDTIFVYKGKYYEDVEIGKTINLIGEDRDTTIINATEIGILVECVNYVNISGFIIENGSFAGISVINANHTLILNNNLSNNYNGIYFISSSNNSITNNNINSNIQRGIYLKYSYNNNITTNNLSNNWLNIDLASSDITNINSNNVSNGWHGIVIYQSISIITGNNILNNEVGICLWSSLYNNVTNNNFINDGISMNGDQLSHYNSHNIADNNIVNSKPIYYYKNCSNLDIDNMSIGQLILANCTNITVTNLQINNTDVGIEVAHSKNINITGNNISFTDWRAIELSSSSNINIANNYISFSLLSINLHDSSNNNIITKNNIFLSYMGIRLDDSSYNNIISNHISMIERIGIRIVLSSNNDINNNTVSSSDYEGISLSFSDNNVIKDNIVYSNMGAGIHILSSSNNIITDNNVANNGYGIGLDSATSTGIYYNNIISNTNQAWDNTNNQNQWDNGYPSGGNYWSDFDEPSEAAFDDYQGIDQNVLGSDGKIDNGTIAGGGKNPYVIDADSQDNYPLICPIGNYIFLYEGWNLISLPFIQSDTNLDVVLSSIRGSFDAVQWYNAGEIFDPWKHNSIKKPPNLNDLFSIDHTMGFWIHITKPGGVLFEYFGTPPISNQTITLQPGWNLVGYPSLSKKNRTEALNNISFPYDIDSIWTFDATTQRWKELDNDDYFELGRGYWIHAKTTCVWEVPL